MNTALLLLLPLLLAAWCWVTLTGRDAWPFSAYPMFSRPSRMSDIVVYAVACESADGSVEWWRPRHHRYAERIGQRLRRTVPDAGGGPIQAAARGLALRHELGHVLRLAALERGGELPPWRALHVVRRTVVDGAGTFAVRDQTIQVVPIGELRPGGVPAITSRDA